MNPEAKAEVARTLRYLHAVAVKTHGSEVWRALFNAMLREMGEDPGPASAPLPRPPFIPPGGRTLNTAKSIVLPPEPRT